MTTKRCNPKGVFGRIITGIVVVAVILTAGLLAINLSPKKENAVNASGVGGTGTPTYAWFTNNPTATTFNISTADDLKGFANIVNNKSGIGGLTGDQRSFVGKTVQLANDINLIAYPNWEPIGIGTGTLEFGGTFNGTYKEIYNLYVDRPTTLYAGLFGAVTNRNGGIARISAVGIVDPYVRGGGMVGAIVGDIGGSPTHGGAQIVHCWSRGGDIVGAGTAVGDGSIGGVVGRAISATVELCWSTSNVTGANNDNSIFIGGVVGYANSNTTSRPTTVRDCYSRGNVLGQRLVGGVVGYTASSAGCTTTVTACYATGKVSSFTGGAGIGGVIGGFETSGGSVIISNCVALNSSIESDAHTSVVGRVIGNGTANVTNCYAYKHIKNKSGTEVWPTTGTYNGVNITEFEIHNNKTPDLWKDKVKFVFDEPTYVWSSLNGELPWLRNGSRQQEYLEMPAHLSSHKIIAGSINFSPTTFTYSGTKQEPTVTVTINGVNVPSSSFTTAITSTDTGTASAGTRVGTVTMTLTGLGDYWTDATKPTKTYTITRANIDMSEVEFENKTVTYDGNAHSILATNLPEGVSVNYSYTGGGSGKTEVGPYTVTAIFSVNDSHNYNVPAPRTAALLINPCEVKAPAITVLTSDKNVKADSENVNVKGIVLSVTASATDGGTLTYQWYSNTTKSTTGGYAIYYATDSTFRPFEHTTNQAFDGIGTHYYYCIVTNTIANDGTGKQATISVTSNVITITINMPKNNDDTLWGQLLVALIGGVVLLGGGGFALYWFVIRKRKMV